MPAYDNAGTVAEVAEEILDNYCGDLIIVNDGSTDSTAEVLEGLKHRAVILTHPFNWGKGAALRNGLEKAAEMGFRYAITIDSDGQHFPSDIPVFLDEIARRPDSLIVGARNLTADGMPRKNTFANRFSNFWFKLFTGKRLSDTQSGYRLYPLRLFKPEGRFYTFRYEYELEALVYSAWDGIPIASVPVHVKYLPEGERVSHFRPFRDFVRISIFNTIVLLYCFFWKWPKDFFKALTWKNIKLFIDRRIVHTPETNLQIAEAVALGVFMGIVPVWGYQMLLTFILASALKLNKIIAIVASNISIAPLAPFIIFFSYWTGCKVLGSPLLFSIDEFSLQVAGAVLLQYILGAFILAVAAGFAFGFLTWLILTICGRKAPGKAS